MSIQNGEASGGEMSVSAEPYLHCLKCWLCLVCFRGPERHHHLSTRCHYKRSRSRPMPSTLFTRCHPSALQMLSSDAPTLQHSEPCSCQHDACHRNRRPPRLGNGWIGALLGSAFCSRCKHACCPVWLTKHACDQTCHARRPNTPCAECFMQQDHG